MRTDETNYIGRLKRGKEDALEFVVDLYLPLVKGIAGKVLLPLKKEGLLEECINEIFFSVWEHADQFRGEDPQDFRRWISGVSRYRAIDFYRREQRKAQMETAAGCGTEDSLLRVRNAQDLSAEDMVVFQEEKEEIVKLLELLEPVDRKIFVMKFFFGMKSEEISQNLGLTKSAVDNRIYRGKKRLSLNLQNAVF